MVLEPVVVVVVRASRSDSDICTGELVNDLKASRLKLSFCNSSHSVPAERERERRRREEG